MFVTKEEAVSMYAGDEVLYTEMAHFAERHRLAGRVLGHSHHSSSFRGEAIVFDDIYTDGRR
jgi:hypothetical protein